MSLHIGIVACSAEGAALCYRTVCSEGAARLGAHAHPEITMHTHSLARYVDCLDRGDLSGVASLMLVSARKLAAAGAQFLICPDNTIHQAFAEVRERSPLPWLHIAEVVAAQARRLGYRRLALTGTRWLVDSEVYPQALAAVGIACVKPAASDRQLIDRIIMDELVAGQIREPSLRDMQRIVAGFRDEGCEAVVLGCTELPLMLNDGNSPLPTLDSTRLLARAALDRALNDA